MGAKRFVVPEGDLDAGDLGILVDQLSDPGAIDSVAHPMRAKQNDAISGASILIFKAPETFAVQRNNGVDPTGPIEIRPLIGEPQMAFDDFTADGLEIDHAGIATEVLVKPPTAVALDLRSRLGMNRPVIEHALLERFAAGMSPPNRFSVDHSDVGTQVLAI